MYIYHAAPLLPMVFFWHRQRRQFEYPISLNIKVSGTGMSITASNPAKGLLLLVSHTFILGGGGGGGGGMKNGQWVIL